VAVVVETDHRSLLAGDRRRYSSSQRMAARSYLGEPRLRIAAAY
jgi:hypothetical protein